MRINASSRSSAPSGGRSVREAVRQRLTLLLSLALLPPAIASTPDRAAAQVVSVEAAVENDALTGFLPGRGNTDREYTHGMWVAVERKDAPWWNRVSPGLRACGATQGEDRCLTSRLEAGQKIFTPDFQKGRSASERPFAGWLFAGITTRFQKPREMRSVRLLLGVTGPPSLAEAFQRGLHRLTDFPDPEGWKNQLAFEPGMLIQYGEARLLELTLPEGERIADLVLSADASLGNVRTGLRGEATGRIGFRVPHPWQSTAVPSGKWSFHALGTVRRQYTAHDLFLDGNTLHHGPRVERNPFSGAVEAGFAVGYGDHEIVYTVVSESRLYRTQPKPHLYHSFRVILRR
jgi:lipid A 3-O-deacylase